jgi:hypothetical protein
MTNNKQQTAVEQFAIALYENGFLTDNGDEIQELLEKAKEMEKEKIIYAYNQSWHFRDKPYETAEKYYNKTFGGNNE